MKLSVRRTLMSIVLLGALLAMLQGMAVADAPSAPTPACASVTAELAVPGASAPLLEAAPALPVPEAGSCTACRQNGQSCWCDPCPSVCESCPKGGVEGFCFNYTCQPICAY